MEGNIRLGEDLGRNINNKRSKLEYTGILPITQSNIEDVVVSGFYSDKTAHVWRLLKNKGAVFMVRPRRFGKSLLIDTIAKIAEGDKYRHLFSDCCIGRDKIKINKHNPKEEPKEYDWKKYPVIRLDFSKLDNESSETLKAELKRLLYTVAKNYGVESKLHNPIGHDSFQSYYENLIASLKALKAKDDSYENKVVVLIDEYDSQLINLDWKSQTYNDCIKVLKDFLTVVKSCTNDCQLIFMTGVTRFSLTDLGSGANIFQGNDVSIDNEFSDVAGYKEEDIENLFQNRFAYVIKELENRKGEKYTVEKVIDAIKSYYNGYRFSYNGISMYNPSSVLSFFQKGHLKGYWYRTGDPSILLKQMREKIDRFDMDWQELRFSVTEDDIMFTKSRKALTLEALMYQTGYLTIDKYDPTDETYSLKFPNKEVRDSLSKNIEEIILEEQEEIGKEDSQHVLAALNEENWPSLLQLFRDSCFANASYEALKDEEKSFQHILHSFLNGACHHTVGGPHMRVEEQTGCGRSDITIDDTKNNVVYIIELKKNQSAEKALKQIEKNKYSNKYYRKKKIVHIGLNCVFNKDDDAHRNINECIIEVKRKDHNNNLSKDAKKKFVSRDQVFVEGVINVSELEDKETKTNDQRSRSNG
ncbi:AAA family ATPase [Cardinium endosymbiont of Culicoides punctatus]|uniref:AAA family ATPase n=1 Tax=Cardinium endosymbiont of Culicoides punctatus TaxID=2304601 RepID=UPI0010F14A35|nr:AAA family ATPase [Cardinium endosymbiont of Culicoides punctatus]TDG95548.1 hypothetical protein CCPUN_02840 [Cardinium endosymbiont of Culicoides punctatus]